MSSVKIYRVSILVAIALVIGAGLAVVMLSAPKPVTRVRPPTPNRAGAAANAQPSRTPAALPASVERTTTPLSSTPSRPAPTPSPTRVLVTIVLTNDHCDTLDFYVDGKIVASKLAEGNRATFDVEPGAHKVQVCLPGTSKCAPEMTVDWPTSGPAAIARGQCNVTITVTNDHCGPADLYVDEKLIVIALAPKATNTFQIEAGEHLIQACPAGVRDCGDTVLADWTASTAFAIPAGPDCKP